jgi:hypothetical protein
MKEGKKTRLPVVVKTVIKEEEKEGNLD